MRWHRRKAQTEDQEEEDEDAGSDGSSSSSDRDRDREHKLTRTFTLARLTSYREGKPRARRTFSFGSVLDPSEDEWERESDEEGRCCFGRPRRRRSLQWKGSGVADSYKGRRFGRDVYVSTANSVKVDVSVIVHEILHIDSVNEEFSALFTLKLHWFDPRMMEENCLNEVAYWSKNDNGRRCVRRILGAILKRDGQHCGIIPWCSDSWVEPAMPDRVRVGQLGTSISWMGDEALQTLVWAKPKDDKPGRWRLQEGGDTPPLGLELKSNEAAECHQALVLAEWDILGTIQVELTGKGDDVGYRPKTVNHVDVRYEREEDPTFFFPKFAFTNAVDMPQVIYDEYQFNGLLPEGGEVSYMQKIRGTFSEHLELGRFPVDRQLLRIKIAALTGWEYFHFNNRCSSAKMMGKEYLPDEWVCPTTSRKVIIFKRFFDNTTLYSTCQVLIPVQRVPRYYCVNVVFPLMGINAASYISTYISPNEIADRAAVQSAFLLTVVAFKYTVTSYLPKKCYLTMLDWFVTISFAYQVILNLKDVFFLASQCHDSMGDEILDTLQISPLNIWGQWASDASKGCDFIAKPWVVKFGGPLISFSFVIYLLSSLVVALILEVCSCQCFSYGHCVRQSWDQVYEQNDAGAEGSTVNEWSNAWPLNPDSGAERLLWPACCQGGHGE